MLNFFKYKLKYLSFLMSAINQIPLVDEAVCRRGRSNLVAAKEPKAEPEVKEPATTVSFNVVRFREKIWYEFV